MSGHSAAKMPRASQGAEDADAGEAQQLGGGGLVVRADRRRPVRCRGHRATPRGGRARIVRRRCRPASRGRRPSRPAPRGCAVPSARRRPAARCRRTTPRPRRAAGDARPRRRRNALKPHWASLKRPRRTRWMQRVVAARDELAQRAPDHPGARREPGPDGHIAVPGEQRGHERQQRVEPGREVDVEVGDDRGVAGRSRPPSAPALAPSGPGGPPGHRAARRRARAPGPRCRRCSRCRRW